MTRLFFFSNWINTHVYSNGKTRRTNLYQLYQLCVDKQINLDKHCHNNSVTVRHADVEKSKEASITLLVTLPEQRFRDIPHS